MKKLEEAGVIHCYYCGKDITGEEGSDNFRTTLGLEDKRPEKLSRYTTCSTFCGLSCLKLYINNCDIDTQYDPRND